MRRRERGDAGSAGLGTALFFLFAVLMAVIVAGYLLTTAGDLGRRGQEASEEALKPGIPGLKAVEILAERTPSGLTLLHVFITPTAGHVAVDLRTTVLLVAIGDRFAAFTASDATGPATFAVAVIRDADGSFANGTLTQGDLLELTVDLGARAMKVGPDAPLHLAFLSGEDTAGVLAAYPPPKASAGDRFEPIDA